MPLSFGQAALLIDYLRPLIITEQVRVFLPVLSLNKVIQRLFLFLSIPLGQLAVLPAQLAGPLQDLLDSVGWSRIIILLLAARLLSVFYIFILFIRSL